MFPQPAIFLDRDGTLNVEKHHLFRVEDWQWEQKAKWALSQFQRAGFLLIVVSNQSGIARGFYKAADVQKLHAWVQQDLAAENIKIDAYYYCPHHPELSGPCQCRKPGTQMLEQAAVDLNVDIGRSWIIGDKLSDLQAGIGCGLKGALVRTGYGRGEAQKLSRSSGKVEVFDTLAAAAKKIAPSA